jgi:hypothetical protein
MDLLDRDTVCQITGHGFPGSNAVFQDLSVAHVIPITRTDTVRIDAFFTAVAHRTGRPTQMVY